MWPDFDPLVDLEHDFQQPVLELARILPSFYVPLIEDKPQNPIMDALKLEEINSNITHQNFSSNKVPKDLAVLTLTTARDEKKQPDNEVEELWKNAAVRRIGVRSRLLSWDRLRKTHSDNATSTPFLSEQGDFIFSSARYHAQPRLFKGIENSIRLSQNELLASLKTTILGISSQYHTWEPCVERFVQVGAENDLDRRQIIIDGKDEVVSGSVILRFVRIGTLLRRLESLLVTLRTRSAREGPTVHALAHSLSTTLDYIREVLTKGPPSNETTIHIENFPIISIWGDYSIYEELLVALANLFGRSEDLSPDEYPPLESSPVPLLSRIYEHLSLHLDRQSPTTIRAILAFILTRTSQEYIQEIARSVGFAGQTLQQPIKTRKTSDIQNSFEGEDEEDEENIFDVLAEFEDSFPSFLPKASLHNILAAQKSLVLFRIARPDHSLLVSDTKRNPIKWLWITDDIMAAWNCLSSPMSEAALPIPAPLPPFPSLEQEFSKFRLFDLEPGITLPDSSLYVKDTSSTILRLFIDKFPTDLPHITPTLTELTSLVFRDLIDHSSKLSSSLLSLFIDVPGNLNFCSHLVVLRSYLLVNAPSFKSRLLNALFSDSAEYEVNKDAHSLSIQSQKRRQSAKERNQPWAVGLSPSLLERETWPPVGSDLTFFLRTVIVESLDEEKERDEEENSKVQHEKVFEEASWRLGFAIRDLPTGPSCDKWLDPLSIESLDFLYMDYKPPHPLEILISPDIMSKYQRMFTFILRLLRVESALKAVFRISTHRAIENFIFPTLTQSRKMFLHFRFFAQVFVSSLSGYIFNSAIAGNFDPFMAELSLGQASVGDSSQSKQETGINNVFELAQRHSALLDDILSACLLRSGQRGVGDILRHVLELILEFTIVVGELHRGRLQEYQAAPLVEELFQKFCSKMTTLVKVLQGLTEKNPTSKFSVDANANTSRRPTGGLTALHHLLIRLDFFSWWSKTTPKPE